MACARFSSHRINVRLLAATLQSADAEQTWRVLNLPGAGRCCRGALAFQQAWARQTAQARAKPRLRNSLGCCCAATALSFVDCSSEKVSPPPGTSWGEFIGDGKRAAKFEVVISLAE